MGGLLKRFISKVSGLPLYEFRCSRCVKFWKDNHSFSQCPRCGHTGNITKVLRLVNEGEETIGGRNEETMQCGG